jgi:hypothetical protein
MSSNRICLFLSAVALACSSNAAAKDMDLKLDESLQVDMMASYASLNGLNSHRGVKSANMDQFMALRKACADKNFLQCSTLENIYQDVRIQLVESDNIKAADLLKVSCDEGHASACAWLGIMTEYGEAGQSPDKGGAYALYAKACDGKVAPACAFKKLPR